MAEGRKIVQLHKKDDRNDQWIPLTTGECVWMTDYENNGETGEIEQTDNLNNAIAKLENRKADSGETLSAYGITDAYTKDEIDALLSGIYHVQGSLASANIHSTLTNANTRVGDVYDLSDDTVLTDDFVEYEGTATPIAKGTNIVVVNTGTDENPVYKFDTLAMNVSSAIAAATANSLGGIKIGYTDSTVGTRNYAVQLDSNDKAFVNVPWAGIPTLTSAGKYLKIVDNGGTLEASWEDASSGTVTSITAGAGLNTTSNDSSSDGGTITSTGTLYLTKSGATAGSYGDASAQTPSFGNTFKVPYVTVDKYGRVTSISEHTVTLPTPSAYSLPTAANGTLGGIQLGYSDSTANTRNYAVQLDSNNKAFVNVPWSDTDPIPSQSGNSGKFLTTNGSAVSWGTPSDTHRAVKVNGVQKLADNTSTALDLVSGANVSLSESSGAVTISVPITDVTNPTITSDTLAVEYGKNYFVGSSTATAAGVAADQNPVSTLVFTVSGNSGFEANVFFQAGASGSSMSVTLPSGFLLIGEEPDYVSGNVYLVSFYRGTAIFGEMAVS